MNSIACQQILDFVDQLINTDGKNEYIVYISSLLGNHHFTGVDNYQLVYLSPVSRQISARVASGEIDVIFCPFMDDGMDMPICPSVSMLNDQLHSDFLEGSIEEKNWKRYYLWGRVVRSSQRVCVSGELSRGKVVENLDIPESCIVVLPFAEKLSKSESAYQRLREAFKDATEEYRDPIKWTWPDTGEKTIQEPPLVSIITPSYQHGKLIKETIESILTQDYPNVEHIVVDGGSTDETVEILSSYKDRIDWISEKDDGQSDAINKGLRKARGRIIGWVNSDDTLLPGAISKAVHALSINSGSLLVYGEGLYTDYDGLVTGRFQSGPFSVENLLQYCNICQPTVFFSSRLLDVGGILDSSYHMAMDYELWLRYSRITPFLYIPEYLATSRMYAENKTSKYRMRSIRESMKACRHHYSRSSLSWCREYAIEIIGKFPIVRSSRLTRNMVFMPLFTVLIVFDLVPSYVRKMFVRLCNTARFG